MVDYKKTSAAAVTLLGGSGGIGFGASKFLQEKSIKTSSDSEENETLPKTVEEENDSVSSEDEGEEPKTPTSEDSQNTIQTVSEPTPTPAPTQDNTPKDVQPAPVAESTQQPEEVVVAEDPLSKFIGEAKFVVLPTKENQDVEKWDAVVKKIDSTANVVSKGRELKNKCKTLLNSSFKSTTRSTYLDAIKSCTEVENLEKRIKKFGFEPITSDDTDVIETKWNAIKDLDVFEIEEGQKDNYNELENVCSDYAEKSDSFSDDIETRWSNYLQYCVKDNDSLNEVKSKGYWFNAPTA